MGYDFIIIEGCVIHNHEFKQKFETLKLVEFLLK